MDDMPDNDILVKLIDAVSPVIKDVDSSEQEVGVLIIGASIANENDETKVQTFTTSAGFADVIAEGLYAELSAQINDENFDLFNTLRRVIHDLEEDFQISAEIDDVDDMRILH